MGERDADDVLDENHEAKRFFPTDGHNPAAPFPSFPQSPSRYSRRVPLPVIPAVFSGNPRSEQSFPRGQSGVISLWQGEYDL